MLSVYKPALCNMCTLDAACSLKNIAAGQEFKIVFTGGMHACLIAHPIFAVCLTVLSIVIIPPRVHNILRE